MMANHGQRDAVFFEEPLTPGKEEAAALFVAHRLGRGAVLRDLRRLGATSGGDGDCERR